MIKHEIHDCFLCCVTWSLITVSLTYGGKHVWAPYTRSSILDKFPCQGKLARLYSTTCQFFPCQSWILKSWCVPAFQQVQPVEHCSSVGAARKTGWCVQTGKADKRGRQVKLVQENLSREICQEILGKASLPVLAFHHVVDSEFVLCSYTKEIISSIAIC